MSAPYPMFGHEDQCDPSMPLPDDVADARDAFHLENALADSILDGLARCRECGEELYGACPHCGSRSSQMDADLCAGCGRPWMPVLRCSNDCER